ncbi:MAG: aminopeptidase P family protein [Magnetococcales bacterium]|nr:aminopeptidase P family protein [Magnetococcales bacterium]
MTARLIYADSESSADLYYATRFFAPDPFLYIAEASGTSHLITSSLEVDRAKRTAKVDQVHDWEQIRQQHKKLFPEEPLNEATITAFFLTKLEIDTVAVPATFPVSLADGLRALAVTVNPLSGSFWPQREIKTPDEITAIEAALTITGRGMMAGIELIRSSTIGKDGLLYIGDKQLSSEIVRGEINATLVREGAQPNHTIVSGGKQGSDPHEEGSGPLPANQAIILDVFPRVEKTGYWGDMTRTVCRGKAPKKVKAAWDAVYEGQKIAFAKIKDGMSGKEIHDEITAYLTQQGFPTGADEQGRQGGFFHGTGHGLGLEIHEAPRISSKDQTLKTGHVVTVEPGLYYPDMGGVRLEDVVVVEKNGCRNLTKIPKFLELGE